MTGAILCGGQSSRMGKDKGLLKLEAKTWAQTAIDKMDVLSLPVVLSVNSAQYSEYAAIFPPGQLVKDNESLLLKGPLCGVLSIHLQYPSEDLFVLACDMPLLDPGLLKELLTYYTGHPSFDAFVYTNENEPEPLCGIYKAKGLAHIIDIYRAGQLSRHSMKFMLEHINSYFVPLPADQKTSFRNFNAHSELNGL
jgi:molybdopterin-guanine dinucleotide biosynthesis protein A